MTLYHFRVTCDVINFVWYKIKTLVKVEIKIKYYYKITNTLLNFIFLYICPFLYVIYILIKIDFKNWYWF